MTTATSQPALQGPWRLLNKSQWPKLGTRLHPEIHRGLHIAAIQEDMGVEEYLHRLLCGHFERLDLVLQEAPDATN